MIEQAVPAPATFVQRRPSFALLTRALSHPLLLLLVGALISALVVPVFTQRWQEHQRELEIQTSLVSELTRSSSAFMTVVRLRLQDPAGEGQDLDEAWRRWRTDSAVTRARLRASYAEHDLVLEWEALDEAMSGFYSFARFADGVNHTPVNLEGFLAIVNGALGSRAANEYGAMLAVDDSVDQLVARVLAKAPKV